MQLVPSFLFGISASLDALLVGVSLGLRGTHIRVFQNLFISLIALLGTCLSVGAGSLLTPFLPAILCRIAGSVILLLLGIYYIAGWLTAHLRYPHSDMLSEAESPALISAEGSPVLSPTQVLLLSMTLSANNLGIGLSASIAGLTLIPAAIATCVCSVLFLYLGNRLGRSALMRLIGGLSDPISGILLIGLGIIQLFF